MSAAGGRIFLGDVVAAIRELRPEGSDAPRVRGMIAELLGFHSPALADLPPTAPPVAPLSAPTPFGEQVPQGESPKSASSDQTETEPSAPVPTYWLPITIETREVEQRRDAARDAAAWFTNVAPLDPPAPLEFETAASSMANPLFRPAWRRAIFGALLATWRSGEIDLDALIEKVAQREHIERLPMQPSPTLRRGAQVLVDTSTGMTPFFADQAWARQEIEAVVGRDLVEVFTFTGVPTNGVLQGMMEEPSRYFPPMSGTPVILLSDLGIAYPVGASDRAGIDQWMHFGVSMRRAGCPLLALIPYAPDRWPRRLQRFVTMIHWDPRTTVGRLRSIIGRAHHVA